MRPECASFGGPSGEPADPLHQTSEIPTYIDDVSSRPQTLERPKERNMQPIVIALLGAGSTLVRPGDRA